MRLEGTERKGDEKGVVKRLQAGGFEVEGGLARLAWLGLGLRVGVGLVTKE